MNAKTKITSAIAALAATAVIAAPASAQDTGARPSGLARAVPAAAVVVSMPAQLLKRSVAGGVATLRAERRERRHQRWLSQFRPLPGGISQSTLDSIAACESGGSPTIVSSDGTYRGKYQFDYGTWASVGGSGDPAAAPEVEQDYRAALLYARSGSSPWPVCG